MVLLLGEGCPFLHRQREMTKTRCHPSPGDAGCSERGGPPKPQASLSRCRDTSESEGPGSKGAQARGKVMDLRSPTWASRIIFSHQRASSFKVISMYILHEISFYFPLLDLKSKPTSSLTGPSDCGGVQLSILTSLFLLLGRAELTTRILPLYL